jgi:uncharacterized protein YecT (DUF1311 family)
MAAIAMASLALQAQTQAGMNQDACAQYKTADRALNATYSKVLQGYAKDPQFLAQFKQAQRAGIVFRDAHLGARFPKANKQVEYGSAYPACGCAVLSELTQQRAKQLQTWVDGIPEGDVCNGNVKAAQAEGPSPQLLQSRKPDPCAKAPGL